MAQFPGHQRNIPSRGRRESPPRPAARFRQEICGWLIAAVVLFLAAAGGWIYWQDYSSQQSERESRAARRRSTPISAPASWRRRAAAARRACREASSRAVRASALFTRAAVAIEQNDTKLATAKYPRGRRRRRPAQAVSRPRADPPDGARVRHAQARRGDRPAAAAGQARRAVVRKRRRDDRAGADQAGQEGRGRAAVRRHRHRPNRSGRRFAPAPCRSPARSASTRALRCARRPNRINEA